MKEYEREEYGEEEYDSIVNHIGCCYFHLEDYKKAEIIFKEFTNRYPDWERPFINLGRVYAKQDKHTEALLYFEKAIEINPHCEDTYYYGGLVYVSTENYEKALEDFKQSLSISEDLTDDDLADAYKFMGLCYLYEDELEKSLFYSEKARFIYDI